MNRYMLIAQMLVMLLFSGSVAAEQVTSAKAVERSATEIFDEIMSPYCPGVTLSACTSPDANVLRTEIRKSLSRGVAQDEIKKRLVRRFGGTILGLPASSGFGIFGWITPVIAFLLGFVIWLRVLKGRRQVESTSMDSRETKIATELEKKIEMELKERLKS